MLDKGTAVLEQNIETLQVLSEAGTKAATSWSSTLDSAPLAVPLHSDRSEEAHKAKLPPKPEPVETTEPKI